MEIERRFSALRVISMILKVLAWLSLVVAVIAAVGIFMTSGRGGVSSDGLPQVMSSGLGGGLLSLGMGIIYFILFYAFAESILVFVDIEENTRLTAILVRDHPALGPAARPVRETVAVPTPAPVVQEPVAASPAPTVQPVEERAVRPAPPPAAPPTMPPGR